MIEFFMACLFTAIIGFFVFLCFLSEKALQEQVEYLANIRARERRVAMQQLRKTINFIGV